MQSLIPSKLILTESSPDGSDFAPQSYSSSHSYNLSPKMSSMSPGRQTSSDFERISILVFFSPKCKIVPSYGKIRKSRVFPEHRTGSVLVLCSVNVHQRMSLSAVVCCSGSFHRRWCQLVVMFCSCNVH